jgi:LysR family hydrogen peroxide-inducible transcriptional activator
MEMHQLRYVVSVARTGNFSRAAEQCNVSQPALSQQIHKLEEELGERLFDRSNRKAKLTRHGELFLGRAVHILEEAEIAKREASDAKRLLTGTVTLGVLPTIAPYLLPDVIQEFLIKYPGIEIIVQEDTTERLLRQAVNLEVDLVIASHPVQDKRLEILPLLTEELLLAVPPKHPFATKRTLDPADLQGERLIVMQDGHCLGDQVLRFCDRREVRAQIAFRSAQLETIQSLVSSGVGISLVPAMARQTARTGIPAYRSMQAPRPSREIIAFWPRQRPLSRGAAELLRMIRRKTGKTEGR